MNWCFLFSLMLIRYLNLCVCESQCVSYIFLASGTLVPTRQAFQCNFQMKTKYLYIKIFTCLNFCVTIVNLCVGVRSNMSAILSVRYNFTSRFTYCLFSTFSWLFEPFSYLCKSEAQRWEKYIYMYVYVRVYFVIFKEMENDNAYTHHIIVICAMPSSNTFRCSLSRRKTIYSSTLFGNLSWWKCICTLDTLSSQFLAIYLRQMFWRLIFVVCVYVCYLNCHCNVP